MNQREVDLIRHQYTLETASIRRLALRFNRSKSTIEKALGDELGNRPDRVTPGHLLERRKKVYKIAMEKTRKKWREFPSFASVRLIAREYHRRHPDDPRISDRQINRDLHASGLKPMVRRAVTTLAPDAVRKRDAFARKFSKKSVQWYRNLVFSDETWVTGNECTGRQQWVRGPEDLHPMEVQSRFNVPAFQVFGVFGYGWKPDLVFMPRFAADEDGTVGYRLNATKYIRKCLSPVRHHLKQPGIVFMQDGARCHVCKQTRTYLERQGIDWLEDWPPYSPDFNPIENVWAELKRRIGALCPMSQEELKAATLAAWDSFTLAELNQYAMSFQGKLKKHLSKKN
jgi:transposase